MKKLFLAMSASALLGACAGNDMPQVELPEIDTNNPLLAEWDTPHATPPFDKISISDYEPAFETAIAVSRAEVDAIVNKAHLAMNDGAMFGCEGEQHMRMNVGTRREVLQQAMQQLCAAFA